GGYAPTPTFRLALADGRRAFFKGTNHTSNDYSRYALTVEERVYATLRDELGRWMPRHYATFRREDWHVLLLEDVGAASVPPWTPQITRSIARALAAFHRSTLDGDAPAWLQRPEISLNHLNWRQTVEESADLQQIAALAGDDAPQALAWLQHASPLIERLTTQPALAEGPHAILHGDLRSDNLRFAGRRLALFDWPSISVGRPEWDIVGFAQSVTIEGGPLPEQILAWYSEQLPLSPAAVESALAWWLMFFADRAWQPDIPGLPRLRRFQRQQLAVLTQWAARAFALPSPAWAVHLLEKES
ncbi:MAG TPA: phosphotransferase, partial [Ktedonobacterales bacterium]|nr:phosphotransferase [Ktedonobacterales bacterium]